MNIRRGQVLDSNSNSKRGFTLIELSAALALALGMASVSLGLLSQHTMFTRILKSFTFIREEAPQINRLLSSLLSTSNDYRIYPDKEALFSGIIGGNIGTALLLTYRNPSGFDDRAAIIFETIEGQKELNYYRYLNGWPSDPNWTISPEPESIVFSDTSGVLTITIIGKNGEKITYVGTTR